MSTPIAHALPSWFLDGSWGRDLVLAIRRKWATISEAWYRDPVLSVVASQEPSALALWPVLIGMAKEASHVDDNPFGEIRTSVEQLALLMHVSTEHVERAIELLTDGGLLTAVIAPGSVRTARIVLTRFTDWQTPSGSSADRSRTHRKAASRDNMCQGDALQQDATQGDVDRDREREREGEKKPPPTPPSNSRNETASLAPMPRAVKAGGEEKEFVDRVEVLLSKAFDGNQRHAAEAILWKTKRRGPTWPGYPLEQWEIGVEQLVVAVRQGTIPEGADPMAYLHGIVPTAMAKLTPRIDAMGVDAPKPVDQSSAPEAIAERRRLNALRLLGKV